MKVGTEESVLSVDVRRLTSTTTPPSCALINIQSTVVKIVGGLLV